MDGRTANRTSVHYGIFDVSVPIAAPRTYVPPHTVWMPRLDTVNVVRFASSTPAEVVVTMPKIPGLELLLQPGTILEVGTSARCAAS